jgi:hypothetical protein
MTTEAPIKIRRGETMVINGGPVLDCDDAVVDISTGSILFTVKNSLADADAAKVFQLSGTSLAVGGTFVVTITSASTISLDLRTRWYDIELTLNGNKSTLTSGRFILMPDVTRA